MDGQAAGLKLDSETAMLTSSRVSMKTLSNACLLVKALLFIRRSVEVGCSTAALLYCSGFVFSTLLC
jgi:hypothetical protein